MKIYHYHPETQVYLGESEADESPLEPDNFLIPAHATEIAPPAVNADEFAVFNGTGWTVEKIPAPEPEPEPTPPTLEELRQKMVLTPVQARLNLKTAGLLAIVQQSINALSEDDDMRILWEYATQIERLNPVLINFCTSQLNLSDEQIDALFNTTA